jgi:glycosyltransferase involved in cell wall biosynthesis
MKNEIMALNPRAILHKYQYPIKKPVVHAHDYPIKEYDIVFTARLIKSKGIEDLLKAVQVVREEIPGVKVKVIGQSDPKYLEVLKNLSVSLGIGETVEFVGFLSTQEEMFEEVAKAKLSVLPTHFDLIPGSVIEAMQIGTPVLAYNTGGLPELNREKETIRLIEVANIGLLAKEIIALLKNEEDRLKLAESATECMVKMFDNDKIYSDMIRAYYDVIEDYNTNRKYL